MLKEGSKVQVVFTGSSSWRWMPGKYTVQKAKSGALGIDYNRTHSPYCEHGEEVIPFDHFADTVLFISSGGKAYHWSNIKERLVYAEID